MMRITMLAAIALTGACDWEFPEAPGGNGFDDGSSAFLRGDAEGFNQESTLWTDTRGTAVDEYGITGGAAMNGTTCQVYVDSGSIGNDVNPNWNEEEEMTDALPDVDGEGVIGLTITPSDINLIQYDDWDSGVVATYDIASLDARFTDDGIATIDNDGGGCEVSWVAPSGDINGQAIAAGACIGGFDVSGAGVALVNTSAGLNRVTPAGSESVADSQNLVSWDAGLDLFYTANRGENIITAMTDSGMVQWTATVGGGVVDLEAAGARGIVFVSVEYADLTGGLMLLDGLTGDVVNQAQTISAARDLSLSGDGHVVAAAVAGQVHYLSVE
ncbi:MAG: hypothetical protein ACJAZO_002636 [Myxococcota bacterium]|jgi:hypothetical protein